MTLNNQLINYLFNVRKWLIGFKTFLDVGSPFLIIPTFRYFRLDSNELLHQGIQSDNMIWITPLVHLIKLCSIITQITGIVRMPRNQEWTVWKWSQWWNMVNGLGWASYNSINPSECTVNLHLTLWSGYHKPLRSPPTTKKQNP
jgi:hypothetical protein